MADVQTTDINTKPTVTAIDSNDQIFISDGGTALKKISYTNLAKAIIEHTHILATTLDDLCTKLLALPSYRTVPLYIPATVTSDLINVNMTGKGYVSKVSNIIADIVIYAGANGELYSVRLNPTTKEVSYITNLPTRAEVDALNSKTYSLTLGTRLTGTVDFNTLTTVGNYYCDTAITATNGPVSSLLGITKIEHSVGHDDNYLIQTYYSARNDADIYRRVRHNGNWGAWDKLPNSRTYSLSGGTQLQANVDLDTLLPGNYYAYSTIAVQHGPFSDICGIVKVEHSAGTDDKYLRQTYRRYNNDIIYERIKDGNTWKDWIKLPARAEVDALKNTLSPTLSGCGENSAIHAVQIGTVVAVTAKIEYSGTSNMAISGLPNHNGDTQNGFVVTARDQTDGSIVRMWTNGGKNIMKYDNLTEGHMYGLSYTYITA